MPDLTTFQERALNELSEITEAIPEINLLDKKANSSPPEVTLELDLSGCERRPGGLAADNREKVTVRIRDHYPLVPPIARVNHSRWVGFPHVLQGNVLCIYLDPASQWNPENGMRGFLHRLWDWFTDAIANNFNAATALYHPVGGVLHRTDGTPTIVASKSISSHSSDIARHITLRPRTPYRVDIASWNTQPGDGLIEGLLVTLPRQLPMGGGFYLTDLLRAVRDQEDWPVKQKLQARLHRTTKALDTNQHLYVIIAVPNPANHLGAAHHLIGWRLSKQQATEALKSARVPSNPPSAQHYGKVEWTYVDDQRPEAHVRRDANRPVSIFVDTSVAVWGCGAIGSWVAELLVRAGVHKVVLRDRGYVTQGLLVRQNYGEEDVGSNKAESLANRLRSISDQVEIQSSGLAAEIGLKEDADNCDFIFDATISMSVDTLISVAQKDGTLQIPVVQVATDNQTATLGIITVTNGGRAPTTRDLDRQLHRKAQREPDLQPFLTFWDTDEAPPLVPTPGCSVPTFNGSSADAMSIAASTVNLAAIPLGRKCAGGYLFATPYAPHQVPLRTAV